MLILKCISGLKKPGNGYKQIIYKDEHLFPSLARVVVRIKVEKIMTYTFKYKKTSNTSKQSKIQK